MQNIQELKNFPVDVWERIRIWYETYYADKKPEQIWSTAHHATQIHHLRWKEMALDRLPVFPDGVEIYYNISGTQIRPHIDRGRRTALQIPIQADYKNSYTFAAKGDSLSADDIDSVGTHSERDNITAVINSPIGWFWKWDPDKYDKHPMDIPILENVAVPHGGCNNSPDLTRILVSITYFDDFESVKKAFSEWV